MMNMRPIHIWAPGIRNYTGGTQDFLRYLVRALLEEFPEHPVRAIVRNDALSADDPPAFDPSFEDPHHGRSSILPPRAGSGSFKTGC